MPRGAHRQLVDPTLRQRIGAQLDHLVSWASLSTERAAELHELVELFGREALDRPAGGPFDGLSRINADGLPFQWSLALGAGPRTVRFLCEAGVPGSSVEERCRLTTRRLGQACRLLDIPWPGWLPEKVYGHVLPPSRRWPGSWRSGMWIAAGASRRAALIKPYFNLNWGPPVERWRRIGWVLKSLGRERSLATLCELSGKVGRDSWPVGLAIDLRPDGSAGRVKAYFRSGAVTAGWLARWYEAVGEPGDRAGSAESTDVLAAGAPDDGLPVPRGLPANVAAAVRSILDAYPWAGSETYPEGAFVLSLEFHPGSQPVSIKTDLAITKWVASDSECVERTCSLLAALGVEESPYLEALAAIGVSPADTGECAVHRFVGLGLEPNGGRHVNVYLEPPMGRLVATRRRAACGSRPALAAAARFLRCVQRPEGCWVDFELPVGRADSWVTAYVLCQLGSGGLRRLDADSRSAAERGLNWLVESQARGGGWGYHPLLQADADSTALAILALKRFGRSVPPGARRRLLGFLRPDGGVATYRDREGGDGAWLESTADVTPVALAALGRRPGARRRRAAARYLLARRAADGLWPSYWWLSRLYPTWVALSWLGPAAASPALAGTLAAFRPAGAFELALLVLCQAAVGGPDPETVRRLNERQRADGSWEGSPILRLTHPEVSTPEHAIDAGSIFADLESIFTTATAYRALASAAGG